MMANTENRLGEIDIFRALAIFLVIGFHYANRWTPPYYDISLYPYDSVYAEWTIFKYGYLGVELFFIVSGFVIALTLERCGGLFEFAVRRLARLWPAMIVCSLITIAFIHLIAPVEPFQSMANSASLLPSWTFSTPFFWKSMFPTASYVDGAYWSLFVEAKFYFWAAIIYFTLRARFTEAFFVFCAVSLLISVLSQYANIGIASSLDRYVLFGEYAMLFCAGTLFWQIYNHRGAKTPSHIIMIILAFLLENISLHLHAKPSFNPWIMTAFVTVFFAMFAGFVFGIKLPRGRVFTALSMVGLASYPLYLLHQHIGVAVIRQFVPADSSIGALAVILVLIAGLIAVSHLIHRHVESSGKDIVMVALRAQRRLLAQWT